MKKKMLYGQDVLVDTFPAHGATISHQLTYQKENMSMLPCYIQPS